MEQVLAWQALGLEEPDEERDHQRAAADAEHAGEEADRRADGEIARGPQCGVGHSGHLRRARTSRSASSAKPAPDSAAVT